MNWGILTMIIVVYSVLFSIIGFFIFVARKAAAVAAAETEAANAEAQSAEKFHNDEICSKNF